ncbi:hypothetical protein A2738_01175 [Candidatus Nomurabacteria bacterium RIFCSPHIGHO2_01_FULL_42_15]|uniref:Peptidoglycan binding-like domain-containing protein n=1 Tax=Candidatus Nomurabacteria bacterium RIFCSPHIGHO2_01_FULL_42_15 TaxID=1801742 RepID=A0A1F6VFV5_9BACT|nr:MAG: hypothetical protein A2738_01175 [Candidatus Nomurabacteria bacterium RIFCSPHIGHO2_01_FULL_42_15]OGI93097.1 MAG: hypothetical protein A3A99_00995 [Candidatus Nomurabacteria bacterium RIFCSPLOWO2_01_FULL_41_18]
MKKLFPFPSLDQGSTDRHANLVLQLMLKAQGIGYNIVPDGVYGPKTIEAVKLLQRLYLVNQTGNFDQATRAGYLKWMHIDIDAIPDLSTETVVPENDPKQAEMALLDTEAKEYYGDPGAGG